MSLFKAAELSSSKAEGKTLEAKGFKHFPSGAHRIGRALRELEQCISELVPDQAQQFATAGRWSLHQLLEYLLRKIGPCRLWMTTWTITEEPMRVLLSLIREGLILELNAVLDYRIERRKPEAFQLASSIMTNIRLTKCHAKVVVLKNEDWNVTILTSANFSKNPRIEVGTIFTDKGSADFHSAWIDEVIAGKEVFRAK
jgi:hypothetical protein